MAKKQNKTQKTKVKVSDFINSIEDVEKKKDTKALLKIFKDITGKRAVMWGDAIIGFGTYAYKRSDGSEHEFMVTGFSPRKQNFSLYIMPGFKDKKDLLEKLGPHKHSVGCLYIKRLSDVHMPTLKKMIKKAVAQMNKNHETW